MTPLRPQTARLRAAAVGPPVRVLLAGDSADLLIPVTAAEALGLGGRRGSFRVRLLLPAGARVVSLSWFERPADGLRYLQATGAQRRLRSDLSLPDGPHEVALAPELGTATNLHVSLVSASPPAEPADALEAAGMTSAAADGGGAAPSVDTAATLTVTGAPQLSGRKRPRDGLPAVSDARSPPGADARPQATTANEGQAVAAEGGSIAPPAQQTVRITARQNSDGRSLAVSKEEARAIGLRGKYRERVVDVPELRREYILRIGWGADRYRVGQGWRELAADMRLPVDASAVLTVADGTICSVERAPAAAAASHGTGTPGTSTANGGVATAADAGGVASPAQQTFQITARQLSDGQSLSVPLQEAHAADLRGEYCDREIYVPELQRKVTLRIGWGQDRFKVARGWRKLAAEMHLPVDASVVLTGADGTICSVERAPAAAAASNSSGMPGASTASGGRALAAAGDGIAAPAQQMFRITVRQNCGGRRLYIPQQDAHAAGLSGKYCDRVVNVPELRREVTLRLGWAAKECRVGRGWRELAEDMRLPVDASVVLAVADGTICSIERAPAAAAASNSSGMPGASTASGGQALAAEGGNIAVPAQQTIRITTRQNGRGLAVTAAEARAAGMLGQYCDHVVDVPELQRTATLGAGWERGKFRLERGWRALAQDMRLPADASVVLTVADGTICSVEQATAAASGSMPQASSGATSPAGARPSPLAALAQQGSESAKDEDGESSATGGQSSGCIHLFLSATAGCRTALCMDLQRQEITSRINHSTHLHASNSLMPYATIADSEGEGSMPEALPHARRLPPGVRPHIYTQPTAPRRPFTRVVSTRDHAQGLPAVLAAGALGPGRAISALRLSPLHTVYVQCCAWRQVFACTPARRCSERAPNTMYNSAGRVLKSDCGLCRSPASRGHSAASAPCP